MGFVFQKESDGQKDFACLMESACPMGFAFQSELQI
jgi:hypothetical protein